ncbi:TRAP transporter small permease [Ponticoccus alexandrii]|uniref:TRAP transporter small permease protein n=1 Tax=Ponticoccus alexandrii TaxID=1943633 RepID=A0ABX7FEK2_9RHOB|nr:TRAP transporter small permease [Ponticoccus alexandrii]QRF68976.1 TRAP transporter small permease subunit [Ponticoccus alexandrii]
MHPEANSNLAGPERPVLRRTLDRLYEAGGTLAALAILGMLVAILVQMGLRLIAVPFDATALSGYLLAAATFLGLAHTQRAGAHIRVRMLIDRLPQAARHPADRLALALFLGLALYATWWAVELVRFAWIYNEMSEGLLAIPLWLPKTAMALGLALLSVSLADALITGAPDTQDNTESHDG